MNKGLDMVSIRIRWNNIMAGMAMLLLFLLANSASADPPPAIIEINGNEQTSGIGSNCWKVENETFSLCADYVGVITPVEPLITRSPFTAFLHLPQQVPPEELEFSTFRVTDDEELKEASNGVRAWSLEYGNTGNRYKRPLEREPDINLSLAPGLYVLRVDANWKEKGSESYGFLVQVNESEAKTTNKVSSGEKTVGFEVFLAITALLLVIIIARNRRK